MTPRTAQLYAAGSGTEDGGRDSSKGSRQQLSALLDGPGALARPRPFPGPRQAYRFPSFSAGPEKRRPSSPARPVGPPLSPFLSLPVSAATPAQLDAPGLRSGHPRCGRGQHWRVPGGGQRFAKFVTQQLDATAGHLAPGPAVRPLLFPACPFPAPVLPAGPCAAGDLSRGPDSGAAAQPPAPAFLRLVLPTHPGCPSFRGFSGWRAVQLFCPGTGN